MNKTIKEKVFSVIGGKEDLLCSNCKKREKLPMSHLCKLCKKNGWDYLGAPKDL